MRRVPADAELVERLPGPAPFQAGFLAEPTEVKPQPGVIFGNIPGDFSVNNRDYVRRAPCQVNRLRCLGDDPFPLFRA